MVDQSRKCILAVAFILASGSAAQSCKPPTIQLGLGACNFSAPGQTDVYSYGVLLGVGNSTELCTMPSTVVNSTLLMSSEVCYSDWLKVDNTTTMNPAQCRSRRGGFVIRAGLPSASTDGLAAKNPGWVGLMQTDTQTPFQYAAQAGLQMRDESVTMIEGLITQGQEHTMSHLGLGEDSSLLQALKDANLIGANSWGLNSGSRSSLAPRDGSLVLGGYDEASVEGPFFTYPIAKPDLLNSRPCPLQVQITEMNLTIQNGKTNQTSFNNFFSQANKIPFCIEP
jgi:hypothetical protein